MRAAMRRAALALSASKCGRSAVRCQRKQHPPRHLRRASMRAYFDDEELTGAATIARPGDERTVFGQRLIGGEHLRENVTELHVQSASKRD